MHQLDDLEVWFRIQPTTGCFDKNLTNLTTLKFDTHFNQPLGHSLANSTNLTTHSCFLRARGIPSIPVNQITWKTFIPPHKTWIEKLLTRNNNEVIIPDSWQETLHHIDLNLDGELIAIDAENPFKRIIAFLEFRDTVKVHHVLKAVH